MSVRKRQGAVGGDAVGIDAFAAFGFGRLCTGDRGFALSQVDHHGDRFSGIQCLGNGGVGG